MPPFQTTQHPGVPRIAVLEPDPARAQALAQILGERGFVPRTVMTPDAALSLVSEWHPHVLLVAGDAGRVLRGVRRACETTQVVVIGTGGPDLPLLAGCSVHAWAHRADPPDRLLASIESACRRHREVAGLIHQRAGLQRIIELVPRLNQLRAPEQFARVAIGAIAQSLDPHASAEHGLLAVRTQRPLAVNYFGIGKYENTLTEFDLPDYVVEPITRAFADPSLVLHAGGGMVVGIPAGADTRGVIWVEGVNAPTDRDDLASVYANIIGQSLNNAVLFQRATIDGLTGLFNRSFGLQRLQELLSMGARYPSTTSVLVLDVDHFKQVNDQHGHAAGDVVLAGVARTVKVVCRDTDVPVRHGGEEFLVLLPCTDEAQAGIAAERLRVAIAEWRGEHDGVPLSVRVSIGVACAEAGDRDGLRLLERADDALYVAKREGRDRVVLAG